VSHRPDCPWENAECTCPKTPTRRYDDKRVCVHCLYCPLPAGVDVGLCANCSRREEAEHKLAAVRAEAKKWGHPLANAILAILEDT
jgi:hypothetical protein